MALDCSNPKQDVLFDYLFDSVLGDAPCCSQTNCGSQLASIFADSDKLVLPLLTFLIFIVTVTEGNMARQMSKPHSDWKQVFKVDKAVLIFLRRGGEVRPDRRSQSGFAIELNAAVVLR